MGTATRRPLAIGLALLFAPALAVGLWLGRASSDPDDLSAGPGPSPSPAASRASGSERSAPQGDASDPARVIEDGRRYPVRTWSFPLSAYALRIEDVGMTRDVERVLVRANAELVVNAGFFDPGGRPLGLALSEGFVLSRPSPTMSGGVVTTDGTVARLWESETFALPADARFGIQCRPRLVVEGAPNVKSDDGHRSERTALCLKDGGRVVDVIVVTGENADPTGPSLFALGKHLAGAGCENALNLDGGPSTGLAWREGGAVRTLPPRGSIRHAIAFVKR